MKAQKYPYTEWEDYIAGMYKIEWGAGRTAQDAVLILSDLDNLQLGMELAVKTWPKAAAHHLTDLGMNQRAWLGWAACGILAQIPAHITRSAWWLLSEQRRTLANDVADSVIASYAHPRKQRSLFELVRA